MTPKLIPLHLMDADPDQPRLDINKDDLKPLALSIRDLGQLQRLPHKFKPTQGDSELVAADRNRTIRTLRYVRVS